MKDIHELKREASAIRYDMQKVFDIINDATNRYIKSKLKARSKKQAVDTALLFADLKDYDSKQDIQDYYGYGNITAAEYERLMNLWDEREQHLKDGKKFRDRVTDMLEKAISHIGDDFQEFLAEADYAERENENPDSNTDSDAKVYKVQMFVKCTAEDAGSLRHSLAQTVFDGFEFDSNNAVFGVTVVPDDL